MKCINKCLCMLILFCSLFLSACLGQTFEYPYGEASNLSNFTIFDTLVGSRSNTFADSLVVAKDNINSKLDVVLEESGAFSCGLLIDIQQKDVLYARNIHQKMHPASLTKLMTALVALENGSLDMQLTATTNTFVDVSGTQVYGLKTGDKLTLEQALNVMLIYSANDVALLIAEGVGGNVAHFVELMNKKAKDLGATNTHFSNPHGLTDDEHYTTAYDIYLMFQEAIKQEKIVEIIQKETYTTTYQDKNNRDNSVSVTSTNRFLSGKAKAPDSINIIGGKTGSTKAAGSCLILYVKDKEGKAYIAEILNSESNDSLYLQMTSLLESIEK